MDTDQPWVEWPTLWDEPLSKIPAAFDVAAAREKLARRLNRRPVRLSKSPSGKFGFMTRSLRQQAALA